MIDIELQSGKEKASGISEHGHMGEMHSDI